MTKKLLNKSELNSVLLPFKYEGALIYSKSVYKFNGFYGIKDDSLFFISLENLESEIEIYSPENTLELQEFMDQIDTILQKLAMNGDMTFATHMTPISTEELMRPFIDFTKRYENNLNLMEAIKNGII